MSNTNKVIIVLRGDFDLIPSKDPNKQSRILFKGGTMFGRNPDMIPGANYKRMICSGQIWSDGSVKIDSILEADQDDEKKDLPTIVTAKK